MISKIENILAFRYLKPRKKEGFLKVISIFSFAGISLGVAILIIVMSVMNGFRTELINKILGFNPHIIVKPYEKKIENRDIDKLNSLSKIIKKSMFSLNGEGILMSRENTQGILVRAYLKNDLDKIELLEEGIIDGSLNEFEENTISIGKDLAISLDLVAGEEVTLMSSANITTIFGNVPTHQSFKISSIFTSRSDLKFLSNVVSHN